LLNYQQFREDTGASKASNSSKMAYDITSINRSIKDLWAAIDAMEKRARQRVERVSKERPLEKRTEQKKQFVIPPSSTKSRERRLTRPTPGSSSN